MNGIEFRLSAFAMSAGAFAVGADVVIACLVVCARPGNAIKAEESRATGEAAVSNALRGIDAAW